MKKIIFIFVMSFSFNSLQSQIWTEIQKIVASDRSPEAHFGISVAIEGNLAFVGVNGEGYDAQGGNYISNAGAVYVYQKSLKNDWEEIQKLVASDRSIRARFGESIDINNNYLVVGSWNESRDELGQDSIQSAGAVYFFEKNHQGHWIETGKVVASDRSVNAEFGRSVAIVDKIAIIGAPGERKDALGQNAKGDAGAVYLFERYSTGNWEEVQKITPSDRGITDQFGFSVDISAQFAVIGAHTKTDSVDGIPLFKAGAAYIFERNSSNIWTEVEKLVASEQGESDFFGCSVSMSGNTVLVGAFGDDHILGGSTPIATGAAYFFERNSNNLWEEKQIVFPYDYGTGPQFGRSVSLDGNGAIIGGREDSRDHQGSQIAVFAGSAFIFERNAQNIWQPTQKVAATDRDTQDYFGSSVAISGGTAIVGAVYEDEDTTLGNTVKNAGSAYIFERWAPVSISEATSPFPANIYPNPTTGRLFIEMEQVYPEGQIRLYNANGQMILQKDMGQLRETEIQIDGPAGIYALVIQTSPEENKTVKVVKRLF